MKRRSRKQKARPRTKECPRLVKGKGNKGSPTEFQGHWSTCGTWGHKRANCPQKQVNAVNVPVMPSSPSSVQRQQCCLIFSWCVDQGRSLDKGNAIVGADRGKTVRSCWIRAVKITLSQPRSLLRDISGNLTNSFDAGTLDMKLGGPSSSANCRVATVSKMSSPLAK